MSTATAPKEDEVAGALGGKTQKEWIKISSNEPEYFISEFVRFGNNDKWKGIERGRGYPRCRDSDVFAKGFDNYRFAFKGNKLCHTTDLRGIKGILTDKCFRGSEKDFKELGKIRISWWGIDLKSASFRIADDAEYSPYTMTALDEAVKLVLPSNGTENYYSQFGKSAEFGSNTSHGFNTDVSRYGNYRFTIPLVELLEKYKKLFPDAAGSLGYHIGTIRYKQAIANVVFVHPNNDDAKKVFEGFDELSDDADGPVVLEDDEWIWKPESTNNVNISHSGYSTFCCWDHICFAFYMEEGKELKFEDGTKPLSDYLSYCDQISERKTKAAAETELLEWAKEKDPVLYKQLLSKRQTTSNL